MKQKKFRPFAHIIREFEEKVIRAAQKLQAELANKPETILAVSAAQPAATRVSSAAQPALPPVSSANILAAHHGCPVDSGGEDGRGMTLEVKIGCVRDVQRWLATVNVSSGNPEVGSVREDIAVLTRAPRPKAEDVRPLLRHWGVQQMKQRKYRPLTAIICDLKEK